MIPIEMELIAPRDWLAHYDDVRKRRNDAERQFIERKKQSAMVAAMMLARPKPEPKPERARFELFGPFQPVAIRYKDKSPRFASILRAVAADAGIDEADIVRQTRQHKFAFPRQKVMYLAWALTSYSLPEIGRRLGGKDHTTILHGVRKICRLRGLGGMDRIDCRADALAMLAEMIDGK